MWLTYRYLLFGLFVYQTWIKDAGTNEHFVRVNWEECPIGTTVLHCEKICRKFTIIHWKSCFPTRSRKSMIKCRNMNYRHWHPLFAGNIMVQNKNLRNFVVNLRLQVRNKISSELRFFFTVCIPWGCHIPWAWRHAGLGEGRWWGPRSTSASPPWWPPPHTAACGRTGATLVRDKREAGTRTSEKWIIESTSVRRRNR